MYEAHFVVGRRNTLMLERKILFLSGKNTSGQTLRFYYINCYIIMRSNDYPEKIQYEEELLKIMFYATKAKKEDVTESINSKPWRTSMAH